MSQRVGGIIQVQVNGTVENAKGNWSYNLGKPMREPVIGADGVHGYKETPQVAFVEGEITDRAGLNLAALCSLTNATVTVDLANGKMIALRNAWWAGEGTGNTEEGNIAARFEGLSAEEIA